MNFSQALEAMKAGKKVMRCAWLSCDYIEIDVDNMLFSMRACDNCDYILSADDILADDWELV